MILSNVEIQRAIDEQRLLIDPEPLPRFPSPGTICPYQTSAVDLRLGDEISFVRTETENDQVSLEKERGDLPVQIDLREGDFRSQMKSQFESVTLKEDEPFILHPHCFVLGKTLERVELPIVEQGDCLAARVEGRSSYARCGLLVHFTAPTIHAGFSGSITLELINLGPYALALYPLTPICQLIVETVQGIPFRNDSQFHNQNRPSGVD